jgi:hypothetical protein
MTTLIETPMPPITRRSQLRLLVIVAPWIVVIGLAALDVTAFLVHVNGWVRPLSLERVFFAFVAVDIVAALALVGVLALLIVLRHPWPCLLAVALALLATIAVTGFNVWCTCMALMHAG